MSERIRTAVEYLAAKRRAAVDLAAQLAERHAAFDAANGSLIADCTTAKGEVQMAESELRALVINHVQETGEKRPAPGVEAIVKIEFDYTPEDALAWAKETGMALKVDDAAVKKIAAATGLPFVTTRRVPAVRIATDLDKALGEAA